MRSKSELKRISQETQHTAIAIDAKGIICRLVVFSQKHIVAVIAVRIHLFPFRTEKLSSPSPMVLPHQVGE